MIDRSELCGSSRAKSQVTKLFAKSFDLKFQIKNRTSEFDAENHFQLAKRKKKERENNNNNIVNYKNIIKIYETNVNLTYDL